jgi:Domain of unknown function (DUF4406)
LEASALKIVFISGAYSAPTYAEVEFNIQAARLVATFCARAQIGYFCPHMNSAHFDANAPKEFFMHMDLAIAKCCDAILLLPGWEKSEGSAKEAEWFTDHHKRMFEYPSDWERLLLWNQEN